MYCREYSGGVKGSSWWSYHSGNRSGVITPNLRVVEWSRVSSGRNIGWNNSWYNWWSRASNGWSSREVVLTHTGWSVELYSGLNGWCKSEVGVHLE